MKWQKKLSQSEIGGQELMNWDQIQYRSSISVYKMTKFSLVETNQSFLKLTDLWLMVKISNFPRVKNVLQVCYHTTNVLQVCFHPCLKHWTTLICFSQTLWQLLVGNSKAVLRRLGPKYNLIIYTSSIPQNLLPHVERSLKWKNFSRKWKLKTGAL